MTLDEIMAKARSIYENAADINTMSEALQAVRDASSMIFYLAKHMKELSPETTMPKAGSFHD